MADLPIDFQTGRPIYALDDPLSRMQTRLNEQGIDIESLDERGDHVGERLSGIEPHQLELIRGYIDNDPQQRISSSSVRNLNDMFDKSLMPPGLIQTAESDGRPAFIFPGDMQSRNNVKLMQTANQSYARNRDMLVTPPPIDIQQQIFDQRRQ